MPELARHVCGVIVPAEGSMETVDLERCHGWTGHLPILGPPYPPADSLPSPLRDLGTTFSVLNFDSKFDSISKPQNPPKIVQQAPKTLPQTPPKRLQNDPYLANPENQNKCNPSIRKPHF